VFCWLRVRIFNNGERLLFRWHCRFIFVHPFDSQPNPRNSWQVFLFVRNYSRHMQKGCIPVGTQPYLLSSRRTVVYIVTPDLTHQSSNPGWRAFSSLQTFPGPYHASTSVGTKVLFPEGKAARAWRGAFTLPSIAEVDSVEPYLPSPVYIHGVYRSSLAYISGQFSFLISTSHDSNLYTSTLFQQLSVFWLFAV